MTQELTQLREALRRVKYEAASLADAQVIALEALTAAQPAQTGEAFESVLIDGVAYDLQAPVAAELLRLHIELQALPTQPAAQATPEPVGEPYGWVYTNSQGARVLHLEPSARLDADKQAAATWPNHHKCIPVYTYAPQQVPMPEPVQRLCRYAGQTMRTARNPNITAREAIEIGDYLAAIGITAQGAKGEQT